MASIAAENVGKEVLESLGKGKKVVLGKIALKNGYAPKTADNPKNITNTKSYQRVVSPVIKQMIKARNSALDEINSKDLTKVQYSDLIGGINKLTHDIQVLSGGATENFAIAQLSDKERTRLDLLLNDK